jgi:predicted metal-binding transcription factor (methanogenesis marker protein 9)
MQLYQHDNVKDIECPLQPLVRSSVFCFAVLVWCRHPTKCGLYRNKREEDNFTNIVKYTSHEVMTT